MSSLDKNSKNVVVIIVLLAVFIVGSGGFLIWKSLGEGVAIIEDKIASPPEVVVQKITEQKDIKDLTRESDNFLTIIGEPKFTSPTNTSIIVEWETNIGFI